MAESYNKITNLLNYHVSLNPSKAFPLDARSMFGSYAEAVSAAATAENAGSDKTVYYIGQMLTVYENGIVSHYSIQADKTLKAIGAQVVGDDKTIVIGEGGKLSLKNFGVKYYKYMPKDVIIEGEFTYPDSMPADAAIGSFVNIADVWYVLGEESVWSVSDVEPRTTDGHVLTDGWKSGLTPQVVATADATGFELAWYEPSTTTVEGLNDAMSALKSDVDTVREAIRTLNSGADVEGSVDNKVAAETTRAKGIEEGLRRDVNANTTALGILNGTADTEGSVEYKIAAILDTYLTGDGDTSKMDTLKDLIAWAEEHETDVATYGEDIAANKKAIEDLEAFVGELPEGAQATTVIAYIQEAVAAEKTRAEAKEKELADAIAEVKTVTDAYNPNAFATAEQGAKADTAVQTVVAGETNGHIAVDGNDVKVYELNPAAIDTLGGIKPDGTSIAVDSNGVASVSAVDHSKVTGLQTQLTTTKEAAVEAANTYTNENAVLKENITTAATVPETVEAASDAKVISEKVFMDAMTWKTSM